MRVQCLLLTLLALVLSGCVARTGQPSHSTHCQTVYWGDRPYLSCW
jgi:hypothetical protein